MDVEWWWWWYTHNIYTPASTALIKYTKQELYYCLLTKSEYWDTTNILAKSIPKGRDLKCKCKCKCRGYYLLVEPYDRVMQLNWLYFCGICQLIPLKVWPNTAQGCNHQSTCMPQLQPLCSAALVPNVLPRRDEGSGKPCAVIEAL